MRDWGYGPPPVNRNTGTDKARAADIWDRRAKGETYKEIAKAYGRSVERIRQIWAGEEERRAKMALKLIPKPIANDSHWLDY